jgi:hypothetical protein
MTETVSSTFPHAVLTTVIADTRPTFLINPAPPLRVASTAVPQANTHRAAPLDANGIKRLYDILGVPRLYYARHAFDPGIFIFPTSHQRQIMVHIPPITAPYGLRTSYRAPELGNFNFLLLTAH